MIFVAPTSSKNQGARCAWKKSSDLLPDLAANATSVNTEDNVPYCRTNAIASTEKQAYELDCL